MSNFKINHIKTSYMRLLVVLFLLCYLLVIAWLFLGCCLVVSWLLLGCSLGFIKLCYIHYSFYIHQYLCLYYNINKSWHMIFLKYLYVTSRFKYLKGCCPNEAVYNLCFCNHDCNKNVSEMSSLLKF